MYVAALLGENRGFGDISTTLIGLRDLIQNNSKINKITFVAPSFSSLNKAHGLIFGYMDFEQETKIEPIKQWKLSTTKVIDVNFLRTQDWIACEMSADFGFAGALSNVENEGGVIYNLANLLQIPRVLIQGNHPGAKSYLHLADGPVIALQDSSKYPQKFDPTDLIASTPAINELIHWGEHIQIVYGITSFPTIDPVATLIQLCLAHIPPSLKDNNDPQVIHNIILPLGLSSTQQQRLNDILLNPNKYLDKELLPNISLKKYVSIHSIKSNFFHQQHSKIRIILADSLTQDDFIALLQASDLPSIYEGASTDSLVKMLGKSSLKFDQQGSSKVVCRDLSSINKNSINEIRRALEPQQTKLNKQLSRVQYDLQEIDKIMEKQKISLNKKLKENIMVVPEKINLKNIQSLLDQGANPNMYVDSTQTLLSFAVQNQLVEVTKLLHSYSKQPYASVSIDIPLLPYTNLFWQEMHYAIPLQELIMMRIDINSWLTHQPILSANLQVLIKSVVNDNIDEFCTTFKKLTHKEYYAIERVLPSLVSTQFYGAILTSPVIQSAPLGDILKESFLGIQNIQRLVNQNQTDFLSTILKANPDNIPNVVALLGHLRDNIGDKKQQVSFIDNMLQKIKEEYPKAFTKQASILGTEPQAFLPNKYKNKHNLTQSADFQKTQRYFGVYPEASRFICDASTKNITFFQPSKLSSPSTEPTNRLQNSGLNNFILASSGLSAAVIVLLLIYFLYKKLADQPKPNESKQPKIKRH